jgi:hypothetical protein
MTQPIDLSRRDLWDRRFDDDPPAPARAGNPSVHDASDLPALPDTDTALLARATRTPSGAPRLLLAGLVEAKGSEAATQAALDRFRAAATPTLRTPQGPVTVSIGFRMADDETHEHAKLVGGNLRALDRASGAAGVSAPDEYLASVGRASPEVVARLTQALIDQGRLPPGDPATLRDRVRQMMYDHGIGMDCAGYVRQALTAIRGSAWTHAHLKRRIGDDDLANLGQEGFRRVREGDLRAGDVIALAKRPEEGPRAVGHRVIVFEQHMATDAELDSLRSQTLAALTPGRVRVITVDSSWGSSGQAPDGGVDRRAWWHDEATGQWYWLDDRRALQSDARPYGHPLDGMYRPPERP